MKIKKEEKRDNIIDKEYKEKNPMLNNDINNSNLLLVNNNIENKSNIKEKENIKGVIKYQDDLAYLKSTLGDILNIFDYSISSPLNNYLNSNTENISTLKQSFTSMQNIGKTGELYITELPYVSRIISP